MRAVWVQELRSPRGLSMVLPMGGKRVVLTMALVLPLLLPRSVWSEASSPSPEDIEAAEKLKAEAFGAFRENRYQRGIELMQQADAKVPHPNFAFNVAWAYYKWGKQHCEQSLAAFDRFFARCGECESKSQVEERYRLVFGDCAVRVHLSAEGGGSVSLRDQVAPISLPADVRLRPGSNTVIYTDALGNTEDRIVHAPPRYLARVELLSSDRTEVVLENYGDASELMVDDAWGDLRPRLELPAGEVLLGIPLLEGTARITLLLSPGQRLILDLEQGPSDPLTDPEESVVLIPRSRLDGESPNPDLTLSYAELGLGAVSALAATGFLVAALASDGVDAPKWAYISALTALSFGMNGAALQVAGHQPSERRRTIELIYGVVTGVVGLSLAVTGVYFYTSEPAAEVGHAYLFPSVPCLVSSIGVLAFGTGLSD